MIMKTSKKMTANKMKMKRMKKKKTKKTNKMNKTKKVVKLWSERYLPLNVFS